LQSEGGHKKRNWQSIKEGGAMARLIPAAERMKRARGLIQKARDLPVPAEMGRYDLAYVAGVKDLLQQGRDMIKFIPYSVGATPEMKKEVAQIFQEIDEAEKEILHK
jgi:hypothetical protein